jgi:hypothetical protein
MEDLALATEEPGAKTGKEKQQKIHMISEQEWVSLIVNVLGCLCPELRNILCLGKYTDPNTMHKAYTGQIVLNPLFTSRAAAQACDKQSRLWISNIQAIGDDVRDLRALLSTCIAPHSPCGPHSLVVLTDNPKEALQLFGFDYRPLIISSVPVPGVVGSMKVRCRTKEYQYFFNAAGVYATEYDTPELTSQHHIFSTRDHYEKVALNFKITPLAQTLIATYASGGRCEVIPVQYLDTKFNIADHQQVTVPTNGIPKVSDLIDFSLKLVPEAVLYNPVEMRKTSVHEVVTNPLSSAAVSYEETVKFYESLGLSFPDTDESRARLKRHAENYRQQTIPVIKPTGDQLLAYYKPGYYRAAKNFSIKLNGKKIDVFRKGKQYYVYPVQHSEVIELPETQLLDAANKNETSRKMSLHCTYTALSLTSEMNSAAISEYNSQDGAEFTVITAEEYELARKLQQAKAMQNQKAADELLERLKSQHSRRLHITSKDPNLSAVLEVFPPPDVKTLSEAYPEKLKERISLLRQLGAELTSVQLLHAAIASLKRGVVFTHNVGSGKTRIAAFAAIAAGAKRIAFIAKSKILGEVIKELRDELGLDVVHIHSAACIRALKEEIRQEGVEREKAVQAAKSNGLPAPRSTSKPRFYILSQEFLTIGGLANQTFDPYVIDITETDPANSSPAPGMPAERIHSLLCTRENAEKQIKEQILKLRADKVITGNIKRIPFRFSQHVHECPKCMERAVQRLFSISKRKRWIELTPATRIAVREQVVDYVKRGKVEVGLREFGTFSRQGHCRVCGYLARSYRRIQEVEQEISEDVADILEALGEEEKPKGTGKVDRQFRSALQFPAYRLLKDLFDAKICDEAHTLTGDSMVYEAVSAIHTDLTYLLSGTLLRRTPAEMWQVFTLLWGFRAPEFPYSHEHQSEFIEQHVTYRITKETVHTPSGQKVSSKHQKQEMPEPANAPKLWRLLHQAQLHATNKKMGLTIPDVHRHFLEIPLEGETLDAYDAKLHEMKTAFVNRQVVFSLQQRADWFTRINELQAVALKAKIGKILPIIQEYLSQGRNIIVACKQQKTFEHLIGMFQAEDLDFVKLDEKKPAQPHKRREWLDENFVKSPKPILLTRTPLINESLNNLVKASVIIVVEAEYVFYPLQQLEGRIARPKQKLEAVDIVYMITQHPTATSVDEAMLQMALRRNNANVELVSGNVTQRTNQQLVEMAENQKMKEMELMQTLLADAHPASMDYDAEFKSREQEIEKAEVEKAVIVLGAGLQQHMQAVEPKVEMATPKPDQSPAPILETTALPAVVVPALPNGTAPANLAPSQYGTEGDNYLLPLNVIDFARPLGSKPPNMRRKLNALKRAVAELRGQEYLPLFADDDAELNPETTAGSVNSAAI